MLAKQSEAVAAIITTNDLTHFNPSSVFMHGARWDLNNNEYEYDYVLTGKTFRASIYATSSISLI